MQPSTGLKILFILVDILCVVFSVAIAYLIRFDLLGYKSPSHDVALDDVVFWSISLVVTYYILDLYVLFQFPKIILRILGGVVFSGAGVAIFSFVFLHFFIGRGVFFIQIVSIVVLTAAWRIIYNAMRQQIEKPLDVVLYGPEDVIPKIADDLKGIPGLSVRKQCCFGNNGNNLSSLKEIRWYQNPLIVFVDDPKMPSEVTQHLVECRLNGALVKELADFYEDTQGKVPVHHLKNHWFVYSRGFTAVRHTFYRRAKRVADLGLSLLGIVCLAPLMLIVALLIKLETRGPVFYKQKRDGLNRAPFTLIKFRSMYQNAEEYGAVWAEKDDPRVTKVGKIIRRLRIDELPQLFNVFRGHMSFIGPRPERRIFIKELEEKIPFYGYRHFVKPGITGWAQINYRYGASVEDAVKKLEYDFFYIKNASLLLDLQIVLKTVRVVLFRSGSR